MDLRSMASLYEEALSAAREEGPAAVREYSEPLLRMIQAGTFTFWISGTGINPPDRTF